MNTFEDELTPEERDAFARLPRAALRHDDLAEERLVSRLRTEGLLRREHGRGRRVIWAVSGVAAALLIFGAGTIFGQHLNAPEVVPIESPALQVQQTGTAYVAALVRLSTADRDERSPGLEAGAATLRAAASSLTQLGADDPMTHRIRNSLEQALRDDTTHSTPENPATRF